MKIKFCGATESVTGSSYLIEDKNNLLLIDCGMYQETNMELNNYLPFNFEPSSLKYVILTHAHLDHCGLIPKLFNLGFKGNVYCTYATFELCKVVLADAAKIQEINLRRRINNKGLLYNTLDVEFALSKFIPVETEKEIVLSSECKITFLPVGHILGACSVLINISDKNILFSGDIGRTNQSIIKSFTTYSYSKIKPNYIIMESLYGGKIHPDKNLDITKILEVINRIKILNSKIIIPVFSIHRVQEILEILNFLFLYYKQVNKCTIFLDSPMAIEVTKIYLNNLNLFNSDTTFLNKKINYKYSNTGNDENYSNYQIKQIDRFNPPNLNQIIKSSKSKRLINARNAIILAGSGMADGGRVIKHLYSGLSDPDNYVIFVGYQAEGTLGRQLVDGEKNVYIMDKRINVRANILYLRGFSAHGDNQDLHDWLNKFDLGELKNIFLVHGEAESKENFSAQLDQIGRKNYIPKNIDELELT